MTCFTHLRGPLKRSTKTPFFSDDFSSGWSESLSNVTADFDTDNVCHGTQSRRLTLTGASKFAWFEKTLSSTIDISNADAMLRFYVPREYQATGGGQYMKVIQVIFRDSLGNATTGLAIFTPNQDTFGEFKECTIPISEITVGSCDLSDVEVIRFGLTWDTATAGRAITFDNIEFYTKEAKASTMIRVDDGTANHYAYGLSAITYNIPLIFAIPTDLIDDGGGHLTTAQMEELRDGGCQMANHCNHIQGANGEEGRLGWRFTDATLTTLTSLQDRMQYIQACAYDLINLGFPEWAWVFIVPGGSNNAGTTASEHDLELMRFRGGVVDWMFYAGAGQPGSHNVSPQYEIPGLHEWYGRSELIDGLTPAAALAKLDTVIAAKGHWNTHAHLSWSSEEMDTYMSGVADRVASNDLDVVGLESIVTPYKGAVARSPGKHPANYISYLNP